MSVGYILSPIERAILRALSAAGRPLTGGEILNYYLDRVAASARDQALSRLVDHGLIVAGDQPERRNGTIRVYRVYGLLDQVQPDAEGPIVEPQGADDVLAVMSAAYNPGDTIGLQQVVDTIGVTWERAQAIRAWALSVGAWPYLQPAPCRSPGSRKRS